MKQLYGTSDDGLVVSTLSAGHHEIRRMLNEVADETSPCKRMTLFSALRDFLIQHREIEAVNLFRRLEDRSAMGRRLVAEARLKHVEEIDLLETLYDFGASMDPMLWADMFSDLQGLMEGIMDFKRDSLFPLACWQNTITDAAG